MLMEKGIVVMKETEYYEEVTKKKYEIEELKVRCEQLTRVIAEILTKHEDQSTVINPRDFVAIWNNVFDQMDDGNKEMDMIYTSATLHWNGIVTNLGYGAAFANYVVDMLKELADELDS